MGKKEENRILLVDDEPLLLRNITRLLDNAGYDVDAVGSGELALKKLSKSKYDLVLTDLMMDTISGMDLLIGAKKIQPDIAVIMMTGYADTKVAIEAIMNGADDFMFKPAESEEIYFRIQRSLENIDLKKKIVQRNSELESLNKQLKKDILERKRTEKKLKKSNKDLSDSLAKLKIAQDKLIQSEKLASLGGLISGVMHEINSPIGIGITASSYVIQQLKKLKAFCDSVEDDRRDLKKILDRTYEGASMIHTNLGRAGDLIANFKQVSVDQVSEQPRKVIVDQYIREVLSSLSMEFKQSSHEIIVSCPSDLIFDSRPGALAQILINFVMNAMNHAFHGVPKGRITIDVRADGKNMTLTCSDNGNGIDQEALKHVFDPFYTTRRDQGGTGLGLYVVYNLVTNALNGTIDCRSTSGKGTSFSITVPLTNPR